MGSIAHKLSYVRIGAVDYAIGFKENMYNDQDQRLLGEIDYLDNTIILDPAISEQKQDFVLVHEIVHGIFTHLGVEEHDEGLINGLAEHFYELLRDNPDFTEAFL